MNAFITGQYRYLFQTFPTRNSVRHKLLIGVEAVRLLMNYGALQWALRSRLALPDFDGKKCTVILLSHNRPQNLRVLVKAALKNTFVSKIIVSNSNRNVRISEWIQHEDPRLICIDETKPTRPGYRFVLATEAPGKYFLSVDDDIFLTPRQWAELFQCLLANEAVPHGLTGNLYKSEISANGSPFHHVSEVNRDVDVLIGAYAFTRDHTQRLLKLANRLGLGDLTNLANGEDVLLSFAGEGRPQIHNVGSVFCCASTSLEGVALWRTLEGFWDERVKLYERVRQARQSIS